MRKLRRVFLDIETAPTIAAVWKVYDCDIPWDMIQNHWYLLCWSAFDELDNKLYSDSLHLHPKSFVKDPHNDKPILKSLHAVLDKADVVVAHNGNRFDIPKINARFIQHGLTPPEPYTQVDTYVIAKRKFAFTSNKLDALGEILGCGRKKPSGWSLWERCLKGDLAAFESMLDYNKQDVRLLYNVFQKLAPWAGKSATMHETDCCHACGSTRLQKRGLRYTATKQYQRFVCLACGAWSQDRAGEVRETPAKLVAA